MAALGVQNWTTITKPLEKLEEARLLTRVETRVGKDWSKAQLWQLDPKYGVKVAAALEDIEMRIFEAAPA
jgi:hypothetical protein